jgi:hypothetical protein
MTATAVATFSDTSEGFTAAVTGGTGPTRGRVGGWVEVKVLRASPQRIRRETPIPLVSLVQVAP